MLGVGGVFYVIAYPLLSGETKANKRKAALQSRAPSTGSGRVNDAAKRKKQVADSLKELDARTRSKKITFETRMAQAGVTWSKKGFYGVSLIMGVCGAFVTWVLSDNPMMTGGVALIAGVGLPRWFLGHLRKRRLKKFLAELPSAVDIIVRGIKAGIPLGDCMRNIAAEAGEPVKSEFRAIVDAQAMGLTIAEAVERIVDRVPTPEANFFAIVINIQQKAGGNLAEALNKPVRRLARPQEDARQDQGHVERGQGVRRHHRRVAAHRRGVGLSHQPRLHEASLHHVDGPHRARCLRILDGLRHLYHEEDDQLRHVRERSNVAMDIDTLTSTNTIAMVLVGIATFATILTIALPFVSTDKLDKRMKSVATEREKIRAREREKLTASKGSLRQEQKAYMKQVVDRFNLAKWLGTEEAKAQMSMAGFRGPQAETAFLFFRLIAPIIFLVVGSFYIFVVADLSWPPFLKLVSSFSAPISESRRRKSSSRTRSRNGNRRSVGLFPTRWTCC